MQKKEKEKDKHTQSWKLLSHSISVNDSPDHDPYPMSGLRRHSAA